MLFACDLTVSGAMHNSRAISLLDRPLPIRNTIMRSRADKLAAGCWIPSCPLARFVRAPSASRDSSGKACSKRVTMVMGRRFVTSNLAGRSRLRHSGFPLIPWLQRQRLVDGAEQLAFAERLQKESSALASCRHLPALDQLEAAGDQDDGQLGPGGAREPLQVEAVDRRHADVGDEAIDLAEGFVLEQRLRGPEQMHRMSGRLEQVLERFEHPGIVIDHGDDKLAR